MRGMRGRIALALCMLLLLPCASGALADAEGTAAGGMELPVGSFIELCAQVPDVPLMDAPKGAEDVAYSVVGDSPTVAQIRFILLGRSYCYRAARFGSSASMPDISGIKAAFDSQMELGGVLYRANSASGAGVASWYFESTHSQYSLTVAKGYDAEYLRQAAMAMRSQTGQKPVPTPRPAPYEAAITGTVSAVSSSRVTVIASDGVKYTFSIDRNTVNPYASKVKKGAYVRIAYNTPYEKLCAATYIELVEPAPTAKPTRAPSSATKSGTILERYGNTLRIRRPSGSIYTFYTGCATLYGDLWAGAGDTAKVSYHVDADGVKVATKVTFTVACYNPCPAPAPCPHPQPCPYPQPCQYPLPYPYSGTNQGTGGAYNPQIPDNGAVLIPPAPNPYCPIF